MMTLRKWIWFLSCFFVLAMTVDALALPADSAGEGWTVMVYMVGASDMVRPSNPQRDYFGLDLKEMQAAVRDDTTLLVMTGGAAVRNTEFISEGSGIYRITREGSWLISEYEESMVDPEALQYLLQTGLENAHGSTALILWDHGYGAFEGFGNENRDDQKRLTMPELREALQAGLGNRRLDLLGFDACMMGCVETALTVSPFADYLVASQELEEGYGWDYSFLQHLTPGIPAKEAGEKIIQCFGAYYRQRHSEQSNSDYPFTLSLVRLDRVQALSSSVNRFLGDLCEQMIGNGEAFSMVSRTRASTYAYGRNGSATEYDLIDLGHLAKVFLERGVNAQYVLDALNDCVEYQEGNVPNANGLSLYFPQLATKGNRVKWHEKTEMLPLGLEWRSFLTEFEVFLDAVRAEKYLTKQEDAYAVLLDDELLQDFQRAKYYVLEESPDGSMRLFYAGKDYVLGDHTVTALYHDQCMVIHTPVGDCPLLAFYIQEDAQSAYYQSPIMTVQDIDSTPIATQLRIKYDKADAEWRVLSAFEISDEMSTGRQDIYLDEQAEVWVVNYFYTPVYVGEKYLLPFTKWQALLYPDISFLNFLGEYSLSEEPYQRKEGCRYWLQLVVVDTYQTEYASQLFPL